jgi:uncharacterized protein (DUF924 family)
MDKARAIIEFWVDEVGPKGWYQGTDALDQSIRDKFMEDWEAAKAGTYDGWARCPEKSLALLILLDQFPRNMFRDDPRAFSTDKKAREVANLAIEQGFDKRTDEPQRQFYYLPLMHSECLQHQERCVRLIKDRMPEYGDSNLLHAKVHREVIRKFGRFPYRNDVLGRTNTPPEQAFIKDGGYRAISEKLEAAA